MCPNCNFGPILKAGCDNLRTHHGELAKFKNSKGQSIVNSNSCPKCGYLTEDWKQMRKWDGKISDEYKNKNYQENFNKIKKINNIITNNIFLDKKKPLLNNLFKKKRNIHHIYEKVFVYYKQDESYNGEYFLIKSRTNDCPTYQKNSLFNKKYIKFCKLKGSSNGWTISKKQKEVDEETFNFGKTTSCRIIPSNGLLLDNYINDEEKKNESSSSPGPRIFTSKKKYLKVKKNIK